MSEININQTTNTENITSASVTDNTEKTLDSLYNSDIKVEEPKEELMDFTREEIAMGLKEMADAGMIYGNGMDNIAKSIANDMIEEEIEKKLLE